VQDIFIELWQNADRFDSQRGREVAFIAVLARRRIIDKLRRLRARPEGRATVIENAVEVQGGTCPADRIELADELKRVHAAMDTLGPEQNRALCLAVCDGLTHREVAQTLDLPLGTVKTHVRRGLSRLREMLRPAGEVSS